MESDIAKGVCIDDTSVRAERKRQREKIAEFEKVKRRKEERVLERAQREEEMSLIAGERVCAEFQDWEKKEAEFDFEQNQIRSQIRLHEDRMKPIDILYKHLILDDLDMKINEPFLVFKIVTVREMEELREDIKMYMDFDSATQTHGEYWEALLFICDWELAET